jgi:hypothetical protein
VVTPDEKSCRQALAEASTVATGARRFIWVRFFQQPLTTMPGRGWTRWCKGSMTSKSCEGSYQRLTVPR